VNESPGYDAGAAGELLARWQQDGDVEALDLLLRSEVEALAARLRARARGMLRPSMSASDLAQEAVFRMLRLEEPPEFDEPLQLRAYLWKAAWGLLVNRGQARGRPFVPLSQAESQELAVAISGADGARAAEREDQATALNVILNLMRMEDREVLELVYFQHLPIEAVAERLGVQRAAVDMRLSRARRRMAEKMIGWADVVA